MSNLNPNLKGGPKKSTTFDDLCMLRSRIPRLSLSQFNDIHPNDNIIEVVQKNHGVHRVNMSEVAAWVLSATHWYALLKQPMMVVIWCRDWEDASRFQYLMQILQVQFHDYVPKYHIQQLYGMVSRNSMGWSAGTWVHGRDASR